MGARNIPIYGLLIFISKTFNSPENLPIHSGIILLRLMVGSLVDLVSLIADLYWNELAKQDRLHWCRLGGSGVIMVIEWWRSNEFAVAIIVDNVVSDWSGCVGDDHGGGDSCGNKVAGDVIVSFVANLFGLSVRDALCYGDSWRSNDVIVDNIANDFRACIGSLHGYGEIWWFRVLVQLVRRYLAKEGLYPCGFCCCSTAFDRRHLELV
jgi:hypothetical protein